ncbi:MAG: helix-turn-helix transcriptional regulator [Dehalococcoidia bacterium]
MGLTTPKDPYLRCRDARARVPPRLAVLGGGGMAVLDSLTERQLEILKRVSDYHTKLEIADELSITEATVESHVHHILHKLHVRTRHRAARIYRDSIQKVEPRRESPRR